MKKRDVVAPTGIGAIRRRSTLLGLSLYAAALSLAALVLAPLLSSGFVGDDVPNSLYLARSTLQAQGANLLQTGITNLLPWIKAGRFFPGTLYSNVLFYFVDGNAIALKVFVLALILLDLLLLSWLVVLLTRSRALGILTILLPPLLFQFREPIYHDPIVAFAGLLPVVFTYVLASLILFVFYLKTDRRRFLVASLVLYALSLVTYEITIAMFPLYFVVRWLYPERGPLLKSARTVLPFAALAGAAVATAVGLRLANPGGFALASSASQYAQSLAAGADPAQGAYAPNFDIVPALKTLVLQCVAALPLSYQALATSVQGHFPSFGADLASMPLSSAVLVFGYATLVPMTGWQARREVSPPSSRFRPSLLIALGLGLLVLPNVLVALSPRYQFEVHKGIAYLPVYISCFGMGVVGAAFVYWLFTLAQRTSRAALCSVAITVAFTVAVVFVGVVITENNRISVESANTSVSYPRAVAASGMQRGLTRSLASGATVVTPEPPAFFAANGGLVVRTVWTADPVGWLPDGTPKRSTADGSVIYTVPPATPLYWFSYRASWNGNGVAILGRIVQLTVSAAGKRSMLLEPEYVYIAAAPLAADTPTLLFGPRGPGFNGVSPAEIGVDPVTMEVIDSGSDGTLYETRQGISISVQL